MAETFREIIGKTMLNAPSAGALLVRTWVEDGWIQLNERRSWAHLRFQGSFRTELARTGTCDVTAGSDTVVPGTLIFVSADVGRQFRVGSSGLPLTIIALSGANAVLDQAYQGATAAGATAQILSAYITMPDRFASFLTVTDPVNQWRLHQWISEQELALRDPARMYSQDPVALVSGTYSPVPTLTGRVRYELWPYCLTARKYDYLGLKRPAPLVDTSYPDGIFRDRPDIVRLAAKLAAAQWKDPSNRGYDLTLANRLEQQLDTLLMPIEKVDEETYLTMWDGLGLGRMQLAPLDANWNQSHDSVAAPGWGA